MAVSLQWKEFLEEDVFQNLIQTFKKYFPFRYSKALKTFHVSFDEWEEACTTYLPKLRSELRALHFELGRFPTEDWKGCCRAILAAEKICLDVEHHTSHSGHPPTRKEWFSYNCPNDKEIESLINNQLTGVTEQVEPNNFGDNFIVRHYVPAFLTYDVWLVAEFIDLMEAEQSDYSVVISDEVRESLSRRFDHKIARQMPIPELASMIEDGCDMYPYQNVGVRFLQDNNGRGIISFEMGMGKTITALAYLAVEGKRALVVCLPEECTLQLAKRCLKLFP